MSDLSDPVSPSAEVADTADWLGVPREMLTELPPELLSALEEAAARHRSDLAEREGTIHGLRRVLATMVTESRTDLLTGVANRGAFEERLALECARARRSRQPLTVAMIDIDGLKAVNDSVGHAAGDELITRVAQGLRQELRTTDMVARVGGDEFALVLPGVGEEGAGAVAAKLRAAVGALKLTQSTSEPRISVGWTTTTTDRPLRPVELLELADQALYQSRGRRGPRG